jgi:Zn-dependent peptidase ImmA (M78 family)
MPFPRGFKAKANRISLQVRTQLQLAAIDPLDPWAVCRHFDIEVLKLSEIRSEDGSQPGLHFLGIEKSAFSAMTLPVGSRRAIVHNDSHGPARQRSNLTHELAHCFLGHPLSPPLLENGERDRHSGLEEEAAFLGGSLLISNEAAIHIVLNQIPPAEATTHYGVSVRMLSYRLRVSGAHLVAQRRAAKANGATVRY